MMRSTSASICTWLSATFAMAAATALPLLSAERILRDRSRLPQLPERREPSLRPIDGCGLVSCAGGGISEEEGSARRVFGRIFGRIFGSKPAIPGCRFRFTPPS